MYDKQWILVFGSIGTGWQHVGPFEVAEDADTWAQNNVPANLSWEIVELFSTKDAV